MTCGESKDTCGEMRADPTCGRKIRYGPSTAGLRPCRLVVMFLGLRYYLLLVADCFAATLSRIRLLYKSRESFKRF